MKVMMDEFEMELEIGNLQAEIERLKQQISNAQAIDDYLRKCVQNNTHCAHCVFNHEGICFFAKECFENNQRYYQDEELE